jgi:hypothetical protein
MDKNQISQGTHASVLSTANRQLPWTRILLLSLFLAFGLASQQPRASAQAADQSLRGDQASMTSRQPKRSAQNAPPCEQLLVQCLASGGGARCLDEYDACEAGGLN